MPAANGISGQRGGRVGNVTPGVRQMFAGHDDLFLDAPSPSFPALLRPRLRLFE